MDQGEPQTFEAEIELEGIAWIDEGFAGWLMEAAQQALASYAAMLPASAQADTDSHYAIAPPLTGPPCAPARSARRPAARPAW